jgi:hypothetical protein
MGRDGSCGGNYWCPPANVAEYAEFAGWNGERYDGGGLNDAPGSPESPPGRSGTSQTMSISGRKSTARGGASFALRPDGGGSLRRDQSRRSNCHGCAGRGHIFDGGHGDGLDFLNGADGALRQVPAAKHKFDVFGIHPYMPTIARMRLDNFNRGA